MVSGKRVRMGAAPQDSFECYLPLQDRGQIAAPDPLPPRSAIRAHPHWLPHFYLLDGTIMTSGITPGFAWVRRSLGCVAVLLCSGLPSHALLAQSEPQSLRQLRSAIERHDYSNERRAGYAARACDEFNDGQSCFKRATLADIYHPELGDEALQFKYFIRACGKGIGAGCRRAGDMAAVGKGTKQDKINAYNIYASGCSSGDAESCEVRSALSGEVRQLLAAKSQPAASGPLQGASGGSMPPPTASFAEHSAALEQVTQVTSVGTQGCNTLIGRLSPDQGKSMGELGQRWWRLLEASYRSNSRACNVVPVALSRQVEASMAASAPKAPSPSSDYTSCDSTCQRQKTILDNTPLSCYVKDGRRICNK